MKRITQCKDILTGNTLLVGLSLLSLSLLSSLLFAPSASAVSFPHDLIVNTDTLKMGTVYNQTCDPNTVDWTENWESNIRNVISQKVNDGANSSYLTEWDNRQELVIEQGRAIETSTMTETAGAIMVYWTDNDVTGDGVYQTDGNWYWITYAQWNYLIIGTDSYQTSSGCSTNINHTYATMGEDTSKWTSNGDGQYTFINTLPFDPPYEYDGDTPHGDIVPPDVYRPAYKACIENRQLTITDKSDPLAGEFPYTLHIVITQGTTETQTYFFEGDIQPYGQVIQDLPNDEPFGIQMWYYDENGNILQDQEISDFRETDITFSNTLAACQDTTDPDTVCDENDHCAPQVVNKYPDCTEHNWVVDLWGIPEMSIPSPMTVGCAVGVFWSMVIDFIFDTSNDPLQNPFGQYSTETHGLTAIITAPIVLFTNLSNNDYTCSPMVLPVQHMGNITLPCMTNFYQSTLGSFFTMYQTIISGIISYFVLVNMLRIMKESKDLQSDKIEVTDL